MSKLPVPSLLKKGEEEWPLELVPLEARTLLEAAGQIAPPFASGLFAECHLAHPARTDLVVRLHRADADAMLATLPTTNPLTRVLRRWRTPGDRIGFLPAIDLECDLPGRVVGFFVLPLFEPDLMRGMRAIVERDAARRALGRAPLVDERMADVLCAMHQDLSPRVLEKVRWCRRLLPAWGNFMPGWSCQTRPEGREVGVRAVVTLPRTSFCDYLDRTGWQGNGARLEELASVFWADKAQVSVDLTIGEEGPLERLGLYWETVAAHPKDAVIERLCRRIEGRSWARCDRWNGFLAWLAKRGDERPANERRSFSLKLVVDGGAPPELKAYVSNFDELGNFPVRTAEEDPLS